MIELRKYVAISLLLASHAVCAVAATWPDDVPQPFRQGDIKFAETPNCYTASYSIKAAPAKVFEGMKRGLKANGWTETPDIVFYEDMGVAYGKWTKDNRQLLVQIIPALSPQLSIDLCTRDTPCAAAAPRAEDTAAATALYKALREQYRTLKSYKDRGTQVTRMHSDDWKEDNIDRSEICLGFERSGRFHYEATEKDERIMLQKDDAGVRGSWTCDGRTESFKSLKDGLDALSADHGVIADFLLGEPSTLDALSALQMLQPTEIEGVPCIGIQGFDDHCLPVRIWSGKEDHLIRRIETERQHPGFRVKEENTFDPVANPTLAASDFVFETAAQMRAKRPWSSSLDDVLGAAIGVYRRAVHSLF